MLNNEKRPTKPPPIAAANVFCASENCVKPAEGSRNREPPNVSCIIGDAAPMIPLPAETLRNRAAQIRQNCGVFGAYFRSTFFVVIMAFCFASGVQASGLHASGGTR